MSIPGSLIFDADKVKAIREKQYPDLPIESIEMMIDSAYWEAEEITIEGKKDLTIETNLRNDFLINRSTYFRDKGYTINLIFMLLPDVRVSMDRVNSRVNQKGHFVDVESIKYNFEYSLQMLKQHFKKFDSLYLFDSSLRSDIAIPNPLLILKNNSVSFVDSNAPLWARPLVDEIVQKLTAN